MCVAVASTLRIVTPDASRGKSRRVALRCVASRGVHVGCVTRRVASRRKPSHWVRHVVVLLEVHARCVVMCDVMRSVVTCDAWPDAPSVWIRPHTSTGNAAAVTWFPTDVNTETFRCDYAARRTVPVGARLYAVRAMKEFPLVPTIFCVLPIHRSRLRAFLVSRNENI